MSLVREARWAKKKEVRAERKEAKYHNKAMVASMRGKTCKAASLENKAQKMHIRAQEAHQRHENATLLLQTKRASCPGYNQAIPVQVQYLPGGATVQAGAAFFSGFQSFTPNGVQSTQYISVPPHQPTTPIQPFSYPPQQVTQNQASPGVVQASQGGTPQTTTTYVYPPQGGTYASPDGQQFLPTPENAYPPQQPPAYPGTGYTPAQAPTQEFKNNYPAEPPPAYTP